MINVGPRPETGSLRAGQSSGVRPRGCCRGAMWVACCVGGYPGKTRFLGRPWLQESGGGGRSDYG